MTASAGAAAKHCRRVRVAVVSFLVVLVSVLVPAGAQALTWSALPTIQQQGVADSVADAYDGMTGSTWQPYSDQAPEDIGRAVRDALNSLASNDPQDWSIAPAELGEWEAGDVVWTTADMSAADALLPEEVALAPDTGGLSLVAAAVTVLGGGVSAELFGGPSVEVSSLGAATGAFLESNVDGAAAYDCGVEEFFGSPGVNPPFAWWGSGAFTDSGGLEGSCATGIPAAPHSGAVPLIPDYVVVWEPWGIGTWNEGPGCSDPVLAATGDGLDLVSVGAAGATSSTGSTWLGCTDLADTSTNMDVVAPDAFHVGPFTVCETGCGTLSGASAPNGVEPAASHPSSSQLLSGLAGYFGSAPLSGPVGGTVAAVLAAEVPDCDGEGIGNWSGSWPVSASDCVTAIDAAGYTAVLEPQSDPTCQADPAEWCPVTGVDPAGSVMGLSSTDNGTYTEAASVSLTAGATVYVFEAAGGVTLPSCSGLTVAACDSLLSGEGYNVAPNPVWQQPDTGVSPGYVNATVPPGGSEVTQPSSTDVSIDGAGLLIPAPTPNEVYTQYSTDLHTVGFATVTVEIADADELDPFLSANAVITVSPAVGTYVDPETGITVVANPSSMPQSGTGSGTGTGSGSGGDGGTGTGGSVGQFVAPEPGSIELPQVAEPCSVFPFGVPCWAEGAVASLQATPQAPHWDFSTPFGPLDVDLSTWLGSGTNSMMSTYRTILLIACTLGLVMWLAGKAWGGGASESEGEENEQMNLFDD